ncbi:MAG: bifunctional diaminohydroxyphosphoribosylaminopyrimidine deaminase/5-amino-6-(5-phosphoribosylamino)uracil reductase RibD [Armatimonadota bacterium]|nr:MAG: bifunctional diaminohydroxyphosphoribosylaminopyrimidine deaminase/5-amino-6-(5-phosphoribosylamino)uracil reductase RibD [Armatimonadota bacterium]
MPTTDADERLMSQALRLALRGQGEASPNPMVGAVIVSGEAVVGAGYHRGPGTKHAEIVALEQAGEKARGAMMYLTLEPCTHHGRTPPCAPRVCEASLARVVVASEDPNPKVAGAGIEALRQAGIEVEAGLLREQENRLNEAYRKYMTTGRPFVTLKIAMSLDGKIATSTGESRWITGERARAMAHRMRRNSNAVMVGIGTVLADNPALTVRHGRARRQPLRVVVDSEARTPRSAKVIHGGDPPGLIAVTDRARGEAVEALRREGAEVIALPSREGRVDLAALLEELGRREVAALLVEGGGELVASFIEQDLGDKIVVFIAPKIIGGAEAPTAVAGRGVEAIAEAWPVADMRCRRIGEDLVIEGYLHSA